MALGNKYTRKGATKCNRKAFAKKFRETRALGKPEAALVPLWRHCFELARHSMSVGYCKRAGQELAHARKLSTKYPGK